MYPMAQRTNYLQIFLRLCPGGQILLGFRAGMIKPRRAKISPDFCGFFFVCYRWLFLYKIHKNSKNLMTMVFFTKICQCCPCPQYTQRNRHNRWASIFMFCRMWSLGVHTIPNDLWDNFLCQFATYYD